MLARKGRKGRIAAAVAALGLTASLAACAGSKSDSSMAGMDMKHGMTTGLGQPASGKYDGFVMEKAWRLWGQATASTS